MQDQNLHGELVSLTTEDDVRLDGFFCRSNQPPATSFDAAVITHGLGGNFYSSRLLKHFARIFHELGMGFVLANTRGHDNLTSTIRSGRVITLGAAYEKVSESEFDLAAWSDFLAEQGFENQILLGHSLGAIKSLYSQAHRPRSNVKAIIALSATRLCYQQMIDSAGGDEFRRMLDQAQALVDQGRGQDLMRVTFPFATWMAARAYLEKYGPADKYNWLSFADRVGVPTLLVYGDMELKENPTFANLEQDLHVLVESQPLFAFSIVANADHFYSGRLQVTGDMVKNWVLSRN